MNACAITMMFIAARTVSSGRDPTTTATPSRMSRRWPRERLCSLWSSVRGIRAIRAAERRNVAALSQ